MSITYKDEAGIAGMRVAGRLASELLDYLTPHVVPGVTTDALDKLAHDYIVNVQGAIPAPLNYAPSGYIPYPKSICTSINHQVCHGIPNEKALKKGDILNIDVPVIKDGWHGDTSRMFMIGGESAASIAAKRLCAITYDAMWKGIVMVRPGVRLGDIGHAIQVFAESSGFSVVREFCGHGIGQKFHEEPQVLHYGKPGTLEELKPGMTFTIEPLINRLGVQGTSTRGVRSALQKLSRLTDQTLRELWIRSGFGPTFSLIAVGGYGRGELFPYSDVDVLVLLPDGSEPDQDEALKSRLEGFICACWDVGLEIGSSVRTTADCVAEASKHVTVQTSLLECRLICGGKSQFPTLVNQLNETMDPKAFFVAKTLEMRQRHNKFENTPYSLEPNCKESPGGLRDLQIVLWVAQAT